MNVFIIAAPYQVLSAIEAIHHFNLSHNILVILQIGLFSKDSFEKVINRKFWDSIRFINFFYFISDFDFSRNRPKNFLEKLIEFYFTFDQFKKRVCIERLCKSIGLVENLFLGNYLIDYDLHMRHIANKIHYKNLYLLDVGTDTLRINRQRLQENLSSLNPSLGGNKDNKKIKILNSFFKISIRNIKIYLRRRFIDWDSAGVDSLTFFTCYPLEINGKDQIVRNSYKYSKSLLKKSAYSQDVLFLGQPLVEQGYLVFENFVDYMKKIKSYYYESNLFYVPHPRESKDSIKVIQNDVGIKVKKFSAPIEYEIVFNEVKPQCIAGFFTSALENFTAIFESSIEVVAFYLPEKILLKDRDGVEKIYQNFRLGNVVKVLNV